jgi:hypothetical protein
MRWGMLKCGVVGLLACAVVSCGGSDNVNRSSESAGSAGNTTGGTNGSAGGTGGSTGSASGSSQVAFVIPTTTCTQVGGGSAAGLMILIAYDRPVSYACTVAQACTSYKDLTSIALTIASYDFHGTVGPVGSGTYPLEMSLASSGTIASAQVGKTDASCAPVNPTGGAATGSITIDSVTASGVTGSYDVTVGGTQYSGTIDAAICPSDVIQGDVCSGDVNIQTCSGQMQCI